MPYPAKLMNTQALLAKIEATYGTAIALAATADGQLLAISDRYAGLAQLDYYDNGELGPSPGNLGTLRNVSPVGRSFKAAMPMRAKGAGTTYAATVVPNLHVMLQLAGCDATLAGGAYTYTPTAEGVTYKSGTCEYYKRGEKWQTRGVLANQKFVMDGPKCPIWTFDTMGICDAVITDSAIAAPTYPNLGVQEPVAQGAVVTIGSFLTPEVKSIEWDFGRILGPRWDLTQTQGHAGFVPGGYVPKLTIRIAATALVATPFHTAAGLDAYQLHESANNFGVSVKVGSGTYNNWQLVFPQAQLTDVQLDNDQSLATYKLVFEPYNSTPVTENDAFRIIFAA